MLKCELTLLYQNSNHRVQLLGVHMSERLMHGHLEKRRCIQNPEVEI